VDIFGQAQKESSEIRMGSGFMMNPQAGGAKGRAWSLARTTAFVKTAPT
jgi:hypothetical protein